MEQAIKDYVRQLAKKATIASRTMVQYKFYRKTITGGYQFTELSDGTAIGRIVVDYGPDGQLKVVSSYAFTPKLDFLPSKNQ